MFIFKDSKNNIWVGTYGGGLNLYDAATNSFKHFRYKEKNSTSIGSNYIITINEDAQNNLWLGTDDAGLAMFDRKANGEIEVF